MKRGLSLILALMVSCSMLLSGCGGSSPAPASSAPAPASSTAVSAPADAASGETLLAVQILGPEEELVSGGVRLGRAEEYTQVAAVGRYRIFVRIRPDTGIDEAEILAGVTVLS